MLRHLTSSILFLLLLAAGGLSSEYALAQGSPGNRYVHARLVFDRQSIQPANGSDESVGRIGVLLSIEPGWHTYWQNSGEAAIPTKVEWHNPEGWEVGELNWPAPKRFLERGSVVTFGYAEEVLLWAPLFAPRVDAVSADSEVTLSARVSWLVCKDICVPGQIQLNLPIRYSATAPLTASAEERLFEKYSKLSPRKFSDLAPGNPWKLTALTTSVGSVDANAKVVFSFKDFQIPASIKGDDIAKHIQVFPLQTKNHTLGRPIVGTLLEPSAVPAQQQSASIERPRIMIEAPLKFIKAGEEVEGDKPQRLEGIAVFSQKLIESEFDLSVPWAIEIPAELKVIAPEFQTTSELVKQLAKELTYRDAQADPAKLVASHASEPASPSVSDSGADSIGLLFALFMAFVGGMILNLMPCVLPIISIKIVGFVGLAGETKATSLRSSLAFAAGILSTFLVMALVIVSLRGVGTSLGWGFQFQHPEFVAGLTVIVFFLSLGFFDFYNFELPFIQSANRAASLVTSQYLKHFFDGVLATALSTPCTAPFLGTALAFAFVQPPIVTVAIFLTIGLGLAAPYVYLTTHPSVLALLPKPGDWMFRFRQLMGFFLLATVAWLMFVLHRLTEEGAVWLNVTFLLMFFCFWVRQIVVNANLPRIKHLLWNGVMLVVFLAVSIRLYPSIVAKRGTIERLKSEKIAWEAYSIERIAQAKASQQPVFIDFTADWCITCKFNEFRIIETEETASLIKSGNILPLKADWTGGDERISAALKDYGAEGVPLYVVLPPNHLQPIVLSTLPSQATLVAALSQVAQNQDQQNSDKQN